MPLDAEDEALVGQFDRLDTLIRGTTDDAQAGIARAYIAQLDEARLFARPIATSIDSLAGFHPAEAYHQDYATLHPDNPYIAAYDLPKVENLSRLFPQLYRAQPRLVSGANLVN